MRVNICGVAIDRYTFAEVVTSVVNHAQLRKPPEYVVTPNAHHVVLLQNDCQFRQIYQQARWVVPDGVSLLWAAQFLSTPLAGRVNGTDLFEELCAESAIAGLKVFLLGGRPGAAEKAAKVLQQRYPTLNIVGTYCPPYGFQNNAQELDTMNAAIQAANPDLLFVGLGAPKQESWIYNNYQTLNVPVSLGIGVSFELVSGIVPRAPRWMQYTGLEWLFRLFMEPKRLWQRYLLGNIIFLGLVMKQKCRKILKKTMKPSIP
ncbi:MAG: WecB/TagA/CpsF family glycosyltransferase [Oculatellaceae cyanobacterium Prado106]|jgi:N-acetylglucosaminyldiphosphoundecaprenol N-acetyl-beta-D-mannosaminyltransferase|nr:WecB/TagA/CpsF family glycosyltransferase [Oculatellaceae cyanobacterium Prado106]